MGQTNLSGAEVTTWIAAMCAVLGLLGALVRVWVGVKTDIAALKVTVESLDRQLAITVKQLARLETLFVGLFNARTPS